MNKKTLKALRGSIEKWKKIAEGTGGDHGADNCPLCALFLESDCNGCPVSSKTGKKSCNGSPYDAWRELTSWRGRKDVHTVIVYGLGHKAVSPDAKRVARREQRFLESLLPPEATEPRS